MENTLRTHKTKSLTLLKRLAGKKWGCSRDTLNTTYNVYIKPIITYCGEALITANLNTIQRFQNQSLRLITGAVKSTPVAAMEILTKQQSIQLELEKSAVIKYEKLIRLPFNTWQTRHFSTHLKTQESFLSKIHNIKKQITLPLNKENLLHRINPLQTIDIEYYTDLMEEIKKENTPTEVLKLLALETIHSRFPEEQWLHIFTDGSLLPNQSGAGAGATCHLFSFYKPLGFGTTNFDGEVEAIYTSLQNLLYRITKFQQAVILSDSRAAILAIASTLTPKSQQILECWKCLYHLSKLKKKIVFQWIPAHCGLAGNDSADYLAKKGCSIIQKPNTQLSYHATKRIINSQYHKIVLNYHSQASKNKKWEAVLTQNIPGYPRKSAVAIFRLLTGHDCLAKHLNRIGILPSPLCPLCDLQEEMDQDHLPQCPALINSTSLSEKYWRARELMISLSEIQH